MKFRVPNFEFRVPEGEVLSRFVASPFSRKGQRGKARFLSLALQRTLTEPSLKEIHARIAQIKSEYSEKIKQLVAL